MAVERAGVRAGDRVVDIGCGPGNASVLLAQAAPDVEVRAVDPVRVFALVTGLRAARSRATVMARNGSAENLPVPAGWATLALSVNAFHHWASARRGLAEVWRVLAPGGRLVLVDEVFEEQHVHTRFHREGEEDTLFAGSPAVQAILADLGFTAISLERVEDADRTPHDLLRATRPALSTSAGEPAEARL